MINLQISLIAFMVEKLKNTGDALWDNLTEDQKDRLVKVITLIAKLFAEALLDEDKKKTLKMDMKAAMNAISADISTLFLSARESTDDQVSKAFFNLVLAFMK